MQHIFTKLLLVLTLSVFLPKPVFSQDIKPDLPSKNLEILRLFCDRELYTSSENILFSAFYSLDKNTALSDWSNILYVELIKYDGKSIAQQKVKIEDGRANGYLQIPADLVSGNYYLRAYTKWMRNYSPYDYQYIPVKVVNPFTGIMDQHGDENKLPPEFIENEIEGANYINLAGLKSSYKRREQILAQLRLKDGVENVSLVVSVSRGNKEMYLYPEFDFLNIEFEPGKEISYFPETLTLTLEGLFVESETAKPLPAKAVVLSSTIDPMYLFITSTDESGNFQFQIPQLQGEHQYCLQPLDEQDVDVEFLVSSDFCSREVTLPFKEFALSPEERDLAREMAVAAQIQKDFTPVSNEEAKSMDYPAFYGEAQKITKTEDYIELNNLEEFFYEVMPDVVVNTRNDQTSIQLYTQSSLSIFPPLILIDNIPVANNSDFLSIPSKFFDRIELINGGYIVNNFMFSGLISLFSKNRDLGGLELTGGRQFFDYSLLSGNSLVPEYNPVPGDDRTADVRNTLYFNPALLLQETEQKEISFYTPDRPGTYTISVRGIDADGNYLPVELFEFTVK